MRSYGRKSFALRDGKIAFNEGVHLWYRPYDFDVHPNLVGTYSINSAMRGM
jgi:hypothetical protein